MKIVRTIAAFLFLVFPGIALAQSSPGLVFGQVPTAAQWNSYFAAKQDVLGFTPLNRAGGTMTGPLVTAPANTTLVGFNIQPGAAPSIPNNGDLWVTAAGLFVRVNGVTVGPLSGATTSSFAGTSPIKVTFPAGIVTYAFDFTVANTFLAQQTGQGATTTQPGWYVQIAGDTVPRVHLGTTTADVATMSFGSGSATRDAFIQRVGAANLRYGGPDAATAVAQTISVQNVIAGTSNTAGAALKIAGSRGTGTGVGGNIVFQVAPAGSTGSTQNALATGLTILGSGAGITTGTINGLTLTTGTGTLTLNSFTAALGGNLSTAGAVTFSGAFGFTGTLTGTTALTFPTSGTVTALGNSISGTGAFALVTGPTISSPTFTTAFTATGLVGLPNLASQSANTIVGAASIGSPTALAIPGCTGSANALQWTTGTGFSCQAITAAAGSVAIGTTTITGGTIGNILSHGASNLLTELTTTGSGTVVALSTAPTIAGGSITALTALAVRDTSAAFDVTIAATSSTTLTAGRTLTLDVGNVAHTLKLGTTANTITFPNLASFTVITSGDTGSVTSTILANSLSLVTPNINVATGTSLALNGCSIGSNAFCATGTAAISSTLTSAAHTITSSSANALAVGLNGTTNPALQVDASTASSATGLKIKSAAAAGGLALSVITSGTNENLTIDAAAAGTITIAGTSTGAITLTRATTISAALTYGGVTLSNSVSGTGSMALTAGTTFTGTTTVATLAVTTINAFTLAGTISGGGNQINNVIIGNSTPLAGSFTTLSGSTSVTSPLVIGGSAASSTLTLESTSGAGTTDQILMQTASQVSRFKMISSGFTILGDSTTPVPGYPLVIYQSSVSGNALMQFINGTTGSTNANGAYFGIVGTDPTFRITQQGNAGVQIATNGANAFVITQTPRLGFITISPSYDFSFDGQASRQIGMERNTTSNTAGLGMIHSAGGATSGATNKAGGNLTLLPGVSTGSGTSSVVIQAYPGVAGATADNTATTVATFASGATTLTGTLTVSAIAVNTSAQSGYVCYNSGTGLLTYDGTNTCLVSTGRLKSITAHLTPSETLDDVMRLDPVAYLYTRDDLPTGEQIGLIAEQVQAIDPRLVSLDDEGKPRGVRYMQMTAILAGAIQALKLENDQLRLKVDRIERLGGRQ